MPGNRGSRCLESVLPGLQRLKNKGTGFLLEKWENAGQAGPQRPPPLLGQTWGWAWESAPVSSPQVTPLWTEARGPPRTVPSRSCGQPAHSSAACGSPPCPWLLSSTRSRPALPVCPVSRCGAQPSVPLCTASGPGHASHPLMFMGSFLPLG